MLRRHLRDRVLRPWEAVDRACTKRASQMIRRLKNNRVARFYRSPVVRTELERLGSTLNHATVLHHLGGQVEDWTEISARGALS